MSIVYGRSVESAARATGEMIEEIQGVFRRVEVCYPDLFRYLEENIKSGLSRGYVQLRGMRLYVLNEAGASRKLFRPA